jgi:hypothetical protein
MLAMLAPATALGQTSGGGDVARERDEYAAWLATAPNSPLAAVAQQPIGSGLRLGPADADIPLAGLGEHRVSERGAEVLLESAEGRRPLPRGRPITLGEFTLMVTGGPGRGVLTLFSPNRERKQVEYYPYDSKLVFVGPLTPPERRVRVRVLALDGVEAEAAEAGSVTVPLGGRKVTLLVRRIPTSGTEESELEIFFRDGTNGEGTYPAGRFVALIPERDGRYRLDFNRARNPFCAYSTAYPCPAPWRGNTIPVPVRAGERYLGGGLETPPLEPESR